MTASIVRIVKSSRTGYVVHREETRNDMLFWWGKTVGAF